MYPGPTGPLYTPRRRQYILDNFTPIGLHVLVVDDDPLCLMVLERMLKTCNYKVTTSNRVNHALELLREEDGDFDLVISDVYMPDEDGFKLLEVIGLELDLPVIMVSSNADFSVVMKGVMHGACDYLIKPVRFEELRNIWQHVIRRKGKDLLLSDFKQENDADASPSETQDEYYKKRKEVLEIPEFCVEDVSSSPKKARVNWSAQLHHQFVSAVNQLGIDKAVPKKILDIMNVQGLSRENVASHLQKYRLYLKRLSGVISEPFPIASFQASDSGMPGGSMLIRPGRRSLDPAITVKGLNLGTGLASKTERTQKVDTGAMKSLSLMKSLQEKQAANRAQVLSAIGVGERSCTVSSSRGGLYRMASLDPSFLLQAAAQSKDEDLSCGRQGVNVVDDLAMGSISRRTKMEEDLAMRSIRRSIKMEKDVLDCAGSCVNLDKLGSGSAVPVYMQGMSEEAMKYQGDPMQSLVNEMPASSYELAYSMPSTQYMQAHIADLTESARSELNRPDYGGQGNLQAVTIATRELPTSVPLGNDDTDIGTKQSHVVSAGFMLKEVHSEPIFSDSTFDALIDDIDILPHTEHVVQQQTNCELLDVNEYLQLD